MKSTVLKKQMDAYEGKNKLKTPMKSIKQKTTKNSVFVELSYIEIDLLTSLLNTLSYSESVNVETSAVDRLKLKKINEKLLGLY